MILCTVSQLEEEKSETIRLFEQSDRSQKGSESDVQYIII